MLRILRNTRNNINDLRITIGTRYNKVKNTEDVLIVLTCSILGKRTLEKELIFYL